MVLGSVRDKFPRVALLLQGVAGNHVSIEFIVDTGFNGEFAMPIHLLNALHAISIGERPTALADGSVQDRSVSLVQAIWNEETRPVEVIELNGVPLLGVQLMENFTLTIEMVEGGEVLIESE